MQTKNKPFYERKEAACSSYQQLIEGRSPCAYSDFDALGTNNGCAEIEFFSTPLGIVINASVNDIDESNSGIQDTCKMEISCCKKHGELPPIFLRDGRGSLSFITGSFSLCDIIGRKITLFLGEKQLASGFIRTANSFGD